jgi:PIN domain nuclease of toxin-antitoxin system
MRGLLMDTNALIWFANGDPMLSSALEAIAVAQQANEIFVSPISAWEAALAVRKRTNQPNLGGRDAAEWFQAILELPGTKLVSPSKRIALEAARVPRFTVVATLAIVSL